MPRSTAVRYTDGVTRVEWDYTPHAEWFRFRPSYAGGAIARLIERVGARGPGRRTADVGAGTGILTTMLLAAGVRPIVAIDPNPAMRRHGRAATHGAPVDWIAATGEATGLADAAVDWFVMGSSFNTTDRARCLDEAARVLRPGGWFTCLWNFRDVDADPIQRRVEAIIGRHVPDYTYGVRREDQAPVIAASGRFSAAERLDVRHEVERTLDDYVAAWRSVRSPYWDVRTTAGRRLLDAICADVGAALADSGRLRIVYTTRAWSARLHT